jgi:hypothetical protein
MSAPMFPRGRSRPADSNSHHTFLSSCHLSTYCVLSSVVGQDKETVCRASDRHDATQVFEGMQPALALSL